MQQQSEGSVRAAVPDEDRCQHQAVKKAPLLFAVTLTRVSKLTHNMNGVLSGLRWQSQLRPPGCRKWQRAPPKLPESFNLWWTNSKGCHLDKCISGAGGALPQVRSLREVMKLLKNMIQGDSKMHNWTVCTQLGSWKSASLITSHGVMETLGGESKHGGMEAYAPESPDSTSTPGYLTQRKSWNTFHCTYISELYPMMSH